MTDIEVYMEGGGRTASSRALLREGAEEFLGELRSAARSRGLELRIVCCGGRGEARADFVEARSEGRFAALLLVDSEKPVEGDPRTHLVTHDGWGDLEPASESEIHLMVQVMETWLVADPQALARHYGPAFRTDLLPADQDLETVEKETVLATLEEATAPTSEGRYHKIHHARRLLGLIDSERVQARCPHCKRLFEMLTALIEEAA